MAEKNCETQELSNVWYTLDGKDSDVVLSTKIRLARNLENFDFLEKISQDNASEICSAINDAFSKIDKENYYKLINVSNLDYQALKILNERGIIKEKATILDEAEVFLTNDGSIIPTVNIDDHYRIVSFCSGFDVANVFSKATALDSSLQDYLQVAFSVNFGYTNSAIKDCGSGMKLSVFLHIPGIVSTGQIEKIKKHAQENGLYLKNVLAHFYFLYTINSYEGSEITQLDSFDSFVSYLISTERKARTDFFQSRPSFVKDMVFKSIAVLKFARFLTFEESMQIFSAIKFGFEINIVGGINRGDFLSLFYRIQNAHLNFLMDSVNINFEKDIIEHSYKIDRLRLLLLQEIFANIEIL